MSMEEARERYWESFEVILKAWTEDEFSYRGKHFKLDHGTVFVKPLQKPLPPIWIAASSDETLIKTGQMGFSIMGIPFARSTSLLEVKEKNDLFENSYLRAGHKEKPDVIVALHVYLSRNEEDAVASSRPCFQRVVEYLIKYRRPGARTLDLDTIKKEKLGVFGTPENTCSIFREYEKIGVTHIICMVNFGGVPMPDVRRTMELMSKEVFPNFR